MKLNETSKLMISNDFKDRMRAEYWQLKNRSDGLRKMLDKYKKGELDFTPNCSYDLLHEQYVVMMHYLYVLEVRAAIEKIDLDVESA